MTLEVGFACCLGVLFVFTEVQGEKKLSNIIINENWDSLGM